MKKTIKISAFLATLAISSPISTFAAQIKGSDNTTLPLMRSKRETTVVPLKKNVINLDLVPDNSRETIEKLFRSAVTQALRLGGSNSGFTFEMEFLQFSSNYALIRIYNVQIPTSSSVNNDHIIERLNNTNFQVYFSTELTREPRIGNLIEEFDDAIRNNRKKNTKHNLNLIETDKEDIGKFHAAIYNRFLEYIRDEMGWESNIAFIVDTYSINIDKSNPSQATITIRCKEKTYKFFVRFSTLIDFLNNTNQYLPNRNLGQIDVANRQTIFARLRYLNQDNSDIIEYLANSRNNNFIITIIFSYNKATIKVWYNGIIRSIEVTYELKDFNNLGLITNLGQIPNNDPTTIMGRIRELNPNLITDELQLNIGNDNDATLRSIRPENANYNGILRVAFTLPTPSLIPIGPNGQWNNLNPLNNINIGVIDNYQQETIANGLRNYVKQRYNNTIDIVPRVIRATNISAWIEIDEVTEIATPAPENNNHINELENLKRGDICQINFSTTGHDSVPSEMPTVNLIEDFNNLLIKERKLNERHNLNIIATNREHGLLFHREIYNRFLEYVRDYMNERQNNANSENINNTLMQYETHISHSIDISESDPSQATITIRYKEKTYKFFVRFSTLIDVLNNIDQYLPNRNLGQIDVANRQTIFARLINLNYENRHNTNIDYLGNYSIANSAMITTLFYGNTAIIHILYQYLDGNLVLRDINRSIEVTYELEDLNNLNLITDLGLIPNNEPTTIMARIHELNSNLNTNNLELDSIRDGAAILRSIQPENANYIGALRVTFKLTAATSSESSNQLDPTAGNSKEKKRKRTNSNPNHDNQSGKKNKPNTGTESNDKTRNNSFYNSNKNHDDIQKQVHNKINAQRAALKATTIRPEDKKAIDKGFNEVVDNISKFKADIKNSSQVQIITEKLTTAAGKKIGAATKDPSSKTWWDENGKWVIVGVVVTALVITAVIIFFPAAIPAITSAASVAGRVIATGARSAGPMIAKRLIRPTLNAMTRRSSYIPIRSSSFTSTSSTKSNILFELVGLSKKLV